LVEWARVGQTRIVNGEMVNGEAVSIELTDVPEGEALDVVLSSVAGYIATSRPVEMADRSRFDHIVILATSTAPPLTASTAPCSPPNPWMNPSFKQGPSFPTHLDCGSPARGPRTPRGVLGSTCPASPHRFPGSVPPPPASIGGNSPPAASQMPGQMPVGASV